VPSSKGYKAEEEINDLVRRSRRGKRQKALGKEDEGEPPHIVGSGDRIYGYSFVLNDKGVRIDYCLNNEVILVDATGEAWTEVKAVVFIFESAANGIPLRVIARLLTEKGFPTPYQAKRKRHKNMKEVSVWQHKTVSDIIHCKAYYGEYRLFTQVSTGRLPGKKYAGSRPTTEEEQILHPIPPIVSKELWEKATWRITANKQLAIRNSHLSKEALLRGGFARCAYCHGVLHADRLNRRLVNGQEYAQFYYKCNKNIMNNGQRCHGCCIPVDLLDQAAAAYIAEKIRDTSEVDQKVAELRGRMKRFLDPLHKHLRLISFGVCSTACSCGFTPLCTQPLTKDNPMAKQREQAHKNLVEIRSQQNKLRKDLKEMIQQGIDQGAREYFMGELKLLARQEADAEHMQVPPTCSRSIMAVFHPALASSVESGLPACPDPMTIAS
jgi:hypothetical protein